MLLLVVHIPAISLKAVAKLCGGGGGGRPDMAQAGAKDVAKVEEALSAAPAIIEGMLK